MTLRAKLVVSYLAVIVLLSAANLWAVSASLLKQQQYRLETAEVFTAKEIASQIYRLVIEEKTAELTELLFERMAFRGQKINYILVFDRKGYLLAHTYLVNMPKIFLKLPHVFGPMEDKRIQLINTDGVSAYDIAVPIREGIIQVGTLHMGIDSGYLSQGVRQAMIVSFKVIVPFTIFVVFAALLFGRILFKPIQKLKEAAIRIGKGDMDYKIDILSKDETGQLAEAFRKMIAEIKILMSKEKALLVSEAREAEELRQAYKKLKETQTLLIQAEKLNAVGQLASGVAHEVKNPLGIVLQSVNYLEDKISPDQKELYEIFQMIKNNIQRADQIVRTLVDFSRATSLQLRPENINALLENCLLLVQYKTKLENIEIQKDLGRSLPEVQVDKGKIEQVFINIILNAIQAMPNGGTLTIRTSLKTTGIEPSFLNVHGTVGEEAILVEIKDTGAGISRENLNKVFDLFFTTKGPGAGTGLGLAVTRNIIEMHNGGIAIESEEGRGCRVLIFLNIKKEYKS